MSDYAYDPDFGDIQSLPDFLDTTRVLTKEDMMLIVNQALILIDDLYVHLPLKRAMHAVDPVQRLKLLRRRIGTLDERTFHNEMISIFVELRDLHTNYLLPSPYATKLAFLPFLMEEFGKEESRRYMVSKVATGFTHDTFKPGVLVTHWSGVPIDRAVAMNADKEAGSNEYARHVRGLDRMTIRPMLMCLPPDEAWVIVGYTDGAENFEIRLPWQVTSSSSELFRAADLTTDEQSAVAYAQGLDLITEITNQARKKLFAPSAVEIENKVNDLKSREDFSPDLIKEKVGDVSSIPGILSYNTLDTPSGTFGYIRIWSFNIDPGFFIPEFIRILELLPQNGLIIDVRGNGGGYIMSGERILQLLTSNRIVAENFHFINTDLTLSLTKNYTGFYPWHKSIELSLLTSAVFSQGFPIESPDITNEIGRKYNGPVVVITDARCYSTTDIFAAGFQDNQIGLVLGVDKNTGAGGANVLTHEYLLRLFGDSTSPLQPLPKDTRMRVALRRSTRIGENAGLPLEDVGVRPDKHHDITRNDLLEGNVDLLNAATALLKKQQ